MSMKTIEELRDNLYDELEKIAMKKMIDNTNLEHIYKLSGSIKNLNKIIMQESGEYSEDGEWEARGMYGRESSYANCGKHYVHGHYSRDDGMMYSGKRDRRGRYSRGDGRSDMMEHLHEMMEDAETDKDREAIRRCIKQLEEG